MKEAEEEAKKNGGATQGISMEQRVAIREQALVEQMASIELQLKGLSVLAQKNLEKSKEHQTVLSANSYLNSELQSIKQMLDQTTEKFNAIELLPKVGQRTLKELNLPSIGYFYGPKLTPYLLGGAAIGFLVLSGLAVLMDLADRSYRNPDEIASDLNMPVLGHIPVMEITKVKKVYEAADSSLTTLHHSRGRASEAYRAVRTGLFFSNRGSELKVIQITSPVPGDGKSTLSSNLAVTMAQSGRRVLLIDADFRRPRIAKIFGIDAEIGMAAVVAEKAELDDAIYASPVANLSIMPGGKRPSNPAELLSSPRFKELMEVLRGKFDIIIVDTPPLLAVSDPGAVAAIVDGVVLTMRLRRNVKPLAARATKILESVDARLLGVVVNGVRPKQVTVTATATMIIATLTATAAITVTATVASMVMAAATVMARDTSKSRTMWNRGQPHLANRTIKYNSGQFPSPITAVYQAVVHQTLMNHRFFCFYRMDFIDFIILRNSTVAEPSLQVIAQGSQAIQSLDPKSIAVRCTMLCRQPVNLDRFRKLTMRHVRHSKAVWCGLLFTIAICSSTSMPAASADEPTVVESTFGALEGGEKVSMFTLRNRHGMQAKVIEYGALDHRTALCPIVSRHSLTLSSVLIHLMPMSRVFPLPRSSAGTPIAYAMPASLSTETQFAVTKNSGSNHIHGGKQNFCQSSLAGYGSKRRADGGRSSTFVRIRCR